jgi:hypothetical protein
MFIYAQGGEEEEADESEEEEEIPTMLRVG